MAALTTTASQIALDALDGLAPTLPTAPLKCALVTVMGTATTAGTEVTGGSYARQNITFATATTLPTSNTNTLTYSGMPAVGGSGVVGFDIYDSSATPKRLYYITATAAKIVNAGDTVTVAIGAVTITDV